MDIDSAPTASRPHRAAAMKLHHGPSMYDPLGQRPGVNSVWCYREAEQEVTNRARRSHWDTLRHAGVVETAAFATGEYFAGRLRTIVLPHHNIEFRLADLKGPPRIRATDWSRNRMMKEARSTTMDYRFGGITITGMPRLFTKVRVYIWDGRAYCCGCDADLTTITDIARTFHCCPAMRSE